MYNSSSVSLCVLTVLIIEVYTQNYDLWREHRLKLEKFSCEVPVARVFRTVELSTGRKKRELLKNLDPWFTILHRYVVFLVYLYWRNSVLHTEVESGSLPPID